MNKGTEKNRKIATKEQKNRGKREKKEKEKNKGRKNRGKEEKRNRGKGERRSVKVQVRFVTKLQNSFNLKILIKTKRNGVHHSH